MPDDLCDLCMTAGVNVDRTTPCGKTIGIQCGCNKDNLDGTCNDEDCEVCEDWRKDEVEHSHRGHPAGEFCAKCGGDCQYDSDGSLKTSMEPKEAL